MTRRALIVQHDHVSPPGYVGERLVERGYELVPWQVVPAERFHDPGVEVEFPDFTSFDAVVSMGAVWSTYGDDVASWVRPELDQLQRADAAGMPVLGLCFGGQLVATAHGGAVSRAPSPEVGWVRITSDDEALVPSGRWFAWHYDRWSTPPDAREVARNAAASQAFVLRRNLAVQFHPELHPAMLQGWLDNGGRDAALEIGLRPDQLVAETDERACDARARAHRLVDTFLDVVASR